MFRNPAVLEHWGGAPLGDDEIEVKYLGRRSPAVECFIVEHDRDPIGLVQYFESEREPDGGMDLVLLPDARGRGLGTSVVLTIREFLTTQLGWNRLTVDPDLSNQSATEFWRRMNFVPVEIVSDEAGREPYTLMEWTKR
jgi:aminoglycoside 6'-N-acetyltransferase